MNTLNPEILWWIVATFAMLFAAEFCNYAERRLVKKWKDDRLLNKLEGAFYAYALVCVAMIIVCLVDLFAS